VDTKDWPLADIGILRAIGAAVIVADPDGVVIGWNPAAEELYGWSADEALGEKVGSLIGMPSRQIEPYESMASALAGRSTTTEWACRNRANEIVPVRATLSPLRDDAGLIIGVVGVSVSIAMEVETRQALEESERRFRALVDHATDGIVMHDADGILTYVSPSLLRRLGDPEEEVIGRSGLDFVEPFDASQLRSLIAGSIPGNEIGPVEMRLRCADGSLMPFEGFRTDLLDDPHVASVVWNLHDCTDRLLADEALRASESRYRSIVETAEEGIWIHDVDGRITFANPKMAALVGVTPAQLERRSFFEFVDPGDREWASAKLTRQMGGISEQYESRLLKADGSFCDVLISASPVRDADGTVTGVLQMVTDIGDRKRFEAESSRLVLEDSLTGLASRALVMDRVSQLLARQKRENGLAAVLFLDLDNFKRVNDSLGHDAGDRLLCETARRIRAAVRPEDTVGRFGGDEFVVVLDRLDSAEQAVIVAERISDVMRVPVTIDGAEVMTTASIGVALTPANDAGSLMRDADTAMYRAKERGGSRHELFDSSLRARAVARLELEHDLRRAIEQREFRVHYQPVVDLDGKIVSFEALARWAHPERGQISPGEFIPLAEATGLIVNLGEWILNQACSDLSRWRSQPGYGDLTVAVNLSGRQLAETGFPATVAGILAAHNLDPEAICLEITESVLMDDAVTATAALTAIHDLGVRLAVDDFGTGYSSLLYLRRFPVDALKLDRFFVAGIDSNDQDPAIVRAVIELAHSLGLAAVAEGVETRGQLEALQAMKCDFAQGFHWSPGVPSEAVDGLLRQGTLGPATAQAIPVAVADAGATGEGASPTPATYRASVLVVDDSEGERSLMYHHLEASGWFRVVGDAGNAESAVELAARTKPDIVLLDMAMPGKSGLETLPSLLEVSPTTRVAVLSGYVSAALRLQAFAAGAVAVFEKSAPFESILEQLRVMSPNCAVVGIRSEGSLPTRNGTS
jgi:diguanylate cyclase (GGDEF)-like protein/PAS domain S-box-containing protein